MFTANKSFMLEGWTGMGGLSMDRRFDCRK